jgi:outer membrane beta-barrel protein
VAASWADAGEVERGMGVASERPFQAETGTDRQPAAAAPDRQPAASDNGAYDFNWLDPEKKIYVLQNRRYLKANRLSLSAMAGPGFSNPYRTAYNLDPRLSYHFSEAWGIEAFYAFTFNTENTTYEALRQASATTLPVVREVRSRAGLLATWVPWYAKINVFNNILYFDWYFSGGASTLRTQLDKRANSVAPATYVSQDLFALVLGTGHQYHLGNRLFVRLDFTTSIYRAQVFGDSGDSAWYSNHDFGLGLGVRL